MPVTIDDVMEAAAIGVLRALDARRSGKDTADVAGTATEDLVQAGFNCSVHIVCGGIPVGDPFGGGGRTNKQQ